PWEARLSQVAPCMPNDPYREILSDLAAARVEFIVGGGVACVLHGVERVTMHVDLAVLMSASNLGDFLAVMDRLGLRPRVPIAAESLLDPAQVRRITEDKHALVFTFLDPDAPFRQVDIFLRADLSYEALLPHSEWI